MVTLRCGACLTAASSSSSALYSSFLFVVSLQSVYQALLLLLCLLHACTVRIALVGLGNGLLPCLLACWGVVLCCVVFPILALRCFSFGGSALVWLSACTCCSMVILWSVWHERKREASLKSRKHHLLNQTLPCLASLA